MSPASQSFIIKLMFPKLFICLMILFKGSLSARVGHFSELLPLHVGHNLSVLRVT
jgi:hypothetical protein